MKYLFDSEKARHACVAWIREFFEKNGPGCNAVIGISGGKDSSVVAALCVEALGRERVIGVLMPCGVQPDISDSRQLVEHLGIRHYTVNIAEAVDGIKHAFPAEVEMSRQTQVNLPARMRMVTLYAISQSQNGRVANTCNLSEDWIGYSTRYGDAAGDFAPLGGFTSEEVVAIGEACGLPQNLTRKAPSDGLTGKTDEDNFGFTYAALNAYIRTGECPDPALKEKIDTLYKRNRFKMEPIPYFHWEA